MSHSRRPLRARSTPRPKILRRARKKTWNEQRATMSHLKTLSELFFPLSTTTTSFDSIHLLSSVDRSLGINFLYYSHCQRLPASGQQAARAGKYMQTHQKRSRSLREHPTLIFIVMFLSLLFSGRCQVAVRLLFTCPPARRAHRKFLTENYKIAWLCVHTIIEL